MSLEPTTLLPLAPLEAKPLTSSPCGQVARAEVPARVEHAGYARGLTGRQMEAALSLYSGLLVIAGRADLVLDPISVHQSHRGDRCRGGKIELNGLDGSEGIVEVLWQPTNPIRDRYGRSF